MADPTGDQNDPVSQLMASEAADKQTLQSIVGGYKTTTEQDGYQSAIDAHRDAGSSATAAPAEQSSMVARAAQAALKFGTDAVMHPVDTLEHGFNGALNAVNELAITADQILPIGNLLPGGGDHAAREAYIRGDQGAINHLKLDVNPDNTFGNVVEGVTQFVAAKAAMFGTGGAGAVPGAVQMMGTLAAGFNPHDPHFTDLLSHFPGLSAPVKDALTTNDATSEWEGRLLSSLDALGFEAAGKAASGLVSWIRGVRSVQEAAGDVAGIQNAKPLTTDSTNPTPEVKPDVTTAAGKDVPGAAAPEGTAQDRFMADFDKLPDHETETGSKRVGSAAVSMSKDPFDANTVHMNTIRADETGSGHGATALKQMTDLADKHGATMTLDAIPMDGDQGISKEALSDFYKKQGFTPAEGGLVEGRAMTRAPNPTEAPQPWVPAGTTPAAEAKPLTAAPGAAPIFNPSKVAQKMLTPVSYDQSKAVLDALHDGRYMDMPNMLDDTHRTMPWEQMSDGANLKGVFNAVEDQMGTLIKAAHGTAPISSGQVQQMAQAIGGDVTSLQRLYAGTTGEGGLAARITAGYNMMLASARQLRDLAGPARALDATTPEGAQALLAFQKQLTMHAAIVGQVRQSSAEIGRALWAHRYLKGSADVALSSISEYAGTKLGAKALKDLAGQVADTKDLTGLTNLSDQVAGKGWKNVLQEVAQNGMLSSPTTQLTNIVGNVGNALLKTGERYVAAGIGTTRKIITGTADLDSFREAWAHTMGSYEGLKKGAALAWQAMKDEDFTSKFSPPTTRAIQMNTEGLNPARATFAQAINAVGTAVRWPGRFMGLFDHFTQSVGYEGDKAARAYTQSASEADAKGLMGQARDDYMGPRQAYLKVNPTTEIEQGAMAAGKYSAFLEDPQTKFGGGLMKAFNSAPILKLLVAPFIHRPGNMLRQAMADYTPASVLFDKNRAAFAAGGTSTDLALARVTIGTGAVASAYELAQNGNSVGQRLGNKNTESLDGVPPYSVKLGNNWYKYDRLDPVGLWLGLGADLHEAIQHHYDPNDPDSTTALTKASTAAVQAISHVAMDKSFMKSVQDVMAAMSAKDPARADVLAAKLVQDNVAKLLPFSGALRAAAHGTDTTQRATGGGSLFDGVVASIPYLSQELPPRRDLLGRPVAPASSWNPFNGAPATPDNMDQELSKLALSVDVPSRTINGYTLNAHEWDEVVKNATQTPIIRGMKLEDALRMETSSDSWAANAQAPDGGALRNGGMAQSLINSAYNYGRTQYLQDHPDLNQKKQDEAITRFKASIAQQQIAPVAAGQ